MDDLDLLLDELHRIGNQQQTLRRAVERKEAVVVHPRPEVMDEEGDDEACQKVPDKPKIKVSGGLTGFGVAQDLLALDFSPPEEAPEQFKAVPFDATRQQKIKKGMSGSFGQMDPMSTEMLVYLRRLEEQQRTVLDIINVKRLAGRQASNAEGRTGLPRAARGAADAAPRQVAVRQAQDDSGAAVASHSLQASGTPAKAAVAPVRTEIRADAASGALVRDAAMAATAAAGGHTATLPNGDASPMVPQPKWRQAPQIDMKFEGRPLARYRTSRPSHADALGLALGAAYLGSFALYVFCRCTTMGMQQGGVLLAYQLVVLAAEVLVFSSGLLYNLCQVRGLFAEGRPWTQRQRRKGREAAPRLDAEFRPKGLAQRYRIQVLVYAGGADMARLEQALAAVLAMEMPEGCTCAVHLVDPVRDEAKAALVARLQHADLAYLPAPLARPKGPGPAKPAALNAALGAIFPRGMPVAPADIVLVLDADQVVDVALTARALPYLEGDGVRLVHMPPGYVNLMPAADVFDQGQAHWYTCGVPGFEAWGWVGAGEAGFLVRADALQRIGGFPGYCDTLGGALGLELKADHALSFFHDEALASGLAPTTLAGVRAAKAAVARGHFQMQLRRRQPQEGQLPAAMKLLFFYHAWSQEVSLIVTPLFLAVPLVRILFNIFPFAPNRWFGIGFLSYYLVCTPLLYKAYLPGNLLGAYYWAVSMQALWCTYLVAFFQALCRCYGPPLLPIAHWRREHRRHWRTPMQAAEEQAKESGEAEAAEPADIEVGLQAAEAPNPPPAAVAAPGKGGCALPVFELAVFLVSLAGASIGLWLLFGTAPVSPSSAASPVDLHMLATNLTLVLSILWALANAANFSMSLCHALACTSTAPGADSSRNNPQPGKAGGCGLAAWGSFCLALVLLYAALAVLACIGLGQGSDNLQGYGGNSDYDYAAVLEDSMLFFNAQRSGPVGTSNRIPWRGDSGFGDTPIGGYYQGTSNLKLTFPLATAVLGVAWGQLAAPQQSAAALSEVMWGATYLLACQLSNTTFALQVGTQSVELVLWARPEDMTEARPTYVLDTTNAAGVGADVLGIAAAALAATSLLFAEPNWVFSRTCLAAAEELYAQAAAGNATYNAAFLGAGNVYFSTSYQDDVMLAAAWLARATGGARTYLSDAASIAAAVNAVGPPVSSLAANWDNQWWAANLLMWQLTGMEGYHAEIARFLGAWMGGTTGVAYMPGGLAYAGAAPRLRDAANAAFLALLYAQQVGGYAGRPYLCWARSQLQYMLGSAGRSFVVGFGANAPTHIPNPAASCPSATQPCDSPIASSAAYLSPAPNPNVLLGALVGGPGPRDAFVDARNASDTAVALDFNAGFSGALAMLGGHNWVSTCAQRNGLIDQAGTRLPHALWG